MIVRVTKSIINLSINASDLHWYIKLNVLYHPAIAQLVERRTVELLIDILRSLVQIRFAGIFCFWWSTLFVFQIYVTGLILKTFAIIVLAVVVVAAVIVVTEVAVAAVIVVTVVAVAAVIVVTVVAVAAVIVVTVVVVVVVVVVVTAVIVVTVVVVIAEVIVVAVVVVVATVISWR